MALKWRNLPRNEFNQIYNPRVASYDVDGSLTRYARRSAEARTALSSQTQVSNDLPYGPGPLQTLDLYRPLKETSKPQPLVLFIHGGYWRGLDKLDHSFVVPPLIESGAIVANVNYDLCPLINLDQMVDQIVTAIRFCAASANEWGVTSEGIILIGHSAGAHLSARVINQPADEQGLPADLIAGVAAISGIYEPEIILNLDVNAEAQITKEDAIRNDCLTASPMGEARMAIWAGSEEPQGWIDQSREYTALTAATGFETYMFEEAQTDHFTVLERAFESDSKGWQAIRDLCRFRPLTDHN
jgi:arylformamidase